MQASFLVERVSSLEQPELLPYRTLRRPAEHFQRGIFVAEGEKVTRRLLCSGLEVESLLLTPQWFEQVSAAYRGTQDFPIRAFLAERNLLQQIVGYHIHQGIMAVGRVPPEPSFEALPPAHLLVALDGLTQAENVGVIVRNCAALGVDALISGADSSSPYLRRAVRSSVGTVFSVPIIHSPNLASTLMALRNGEGTRIITAEAGATISVLDVDLTGSVCFVAGNEEWGISGELQEIADKRVVIPMSRGTDSLNVASAVAIFLFEAGRQRSERPPGRETKSRLHTT